MEKQENKQAREWLNMILLELKSQYSELLYPLSVLMFKEAPPQMRIKGMGTDGLTLYYDPDFVLRQGREETMKQIMHIMLHGVLGHFEIKDNYEQKSIRDLMMDLQVDYLLSRMGGVFSGRKQYGWNRLDDFVQGDYSMSSYYRLVAKDEVHSGLSHYHHGLQVDDHSMWDEDIGKEHRKKVLELWGEIQQVVLGEKKGDGNELVFLMGTFMGKEKGDGKEVFGIGKGSGRNYKELLEELFRPKEICREEPDSIDNMFYSYGLALYGDVPLIEPLEITERPALHTLAIAVDVSGSCVQEEIMEKFWGETYVCISQIKAQQTEGEVLILQCDMEIQKEQRIDLTEFREKPVRIAVKGCGGTSFVPVFERLKELEEEDMKVDALIYLTDGEGKYPKDKPDYPVYFVMRQEDMASWFVKEQMPEWINRICLE